LKQSEFRTKEGQRFARTIDETEREMLLSVVALGHVEVLVRYFSAFEKGEETDA